MAALYLDRRNASELLHAGGLRVAAAVRAEGHEEARGCAGPAIWERGKSASLLAKVTGSLADGFTSPNRTLAIASPPPIPGNHADTIPPTLSDHGMLTGPPVSSTTMVCGLAATTAFTRSSWLSGSVRVAASRPSLMGWFTKTMATWEALARAAAAALSVPWLNSTLALGALAWMNFIGEEGKYCAPPRPKPPPCASPAAGGTAFPPGGATCADPPPEGTPTSACDPITAIDLTRATLSGNWLAEFFNRTMLSSSIFRASSSPLNGSTTRRCGGLSHTPVANMLRRIRCTESLTLARGTSLLSTAAFRASPKNPLPGSSWSRPAMMAFLVLCVPPQSDMTKPLKPKSFLRTWLRR